MSADVENSDLKLERSNEIEARRQWATASLIALGFYAALAAFLVYLKSCWTDLSYSTRTICVLGILGANYAVALWGTIRKNAPVGKLFFFVGSFLFALALAILYAEAPTDFQNPNYFLNFLGSSASIVGFWAFGVFVLAFAYESYALHVVAIIATLLWLVVDPREFGAPVALIYCALGEHWAWRRNCSSVSYAYLAASLCVLAESFVIPGLRIGAALIAPLAVLASVVVYWFGVNFRSAPLRGLAILGAASALGVGSFDEYWTATSFALDATSESAASATIALLSDAFSLCFVLYCVNLMTTGARFSVVRFLFGASALVAWVVVVSSRAGSVPIGLAIVAFCVFAFLIVEFRLRASYRERSKISGERKLGTTGTDALDDDAEFDDLFDAEARKVQNAPHVLATAELFEDLRRKFCRSLGNLPLWGAVLLQFVLILFVARKL